MEMCGKLRLKGKKVLTIQSSSLINRHISCIKLLSSLHKKYMYDERIYEIPVLTINKTGELVHLNFSDQNSKEAKAIVNNVMEQTNHIINVDVDNGIEWINRGGKLYARGATYHKLDNVLFVL